MITRSAGFCLNITVIYRPPSTCLGQFTDEFSTLLEQLVLSTGYLLIVGDFNIHVDDSSNPEAANFLSLIESFGLNQMVTVATHKNGHTLDLVITRSSEPQGAVVDIVSKDPALSDHVAVKRRMIKYRNFKSLDSRALADSFSKSPLFSSNFTDVSDLTDSYYNSLSAIIDDFAPMKTRTVTMRPNARWYTPTIDEAKKSRRKAERKWRRTKDPTDRAVYLEKCMHVNQLINRSKSDYYATVISENKGNQRTLFQTVDKLLHRKQIALPTSSSDKHLAERFVEFFVEKVSAIHASLESNRVDTELQYSFDGTELSEFQPVSAESIEAIIRSSPSKSCCLDPIPTWLLKEHLEILLPSIVNMVNMSLTTASFPSSFKKSIVVPLLKKSSLDSDVLKNYRPVSNLAFVSKIIEKAAVLQLNEHLSRHGLLEMYQSAYKRLHSTETALLKVQNDILMSLDKKTGCCSNTTGFIGSLRHCDLARETQVTIWNYWYGTSMDGILFT